MKAYRDVEVETRAVVKESNIEGDELQYAPTNPYSNEQILRGAAATQ